MVPTPELHVRQWQSYIEMVSMKIIRLNIYVDLINTEKDIALSTYQLCARLVHS